MGKEKEKDRRKKKKNRKKSKKSKKMSLNSGVPSYEGKKEEIPPAWKMLQDMMGEIGVKDLWITWKVVEQTDDLKWMNVAHKEHSNRLSSLFAHHSSPFLLKKLKLHGLAWINDVSVGPPFVFVFCGEALGIHMPQLSQTEMNAILQEADGGDVCGKGKKLGKVMQTLAHWILDIAATKSSRTSPLWEWGKQKGYTVTNLTGTIHGCFKCLDRKAEEQQAQEFPALMDFSFVLLHQNWGEEPTFMKKFNKKKPEEDTCAILHDGKYLIVNIHRELPITPKLSQLILNFFESRQVKQVKVMQHGTEVTAICLPKDKLQKELPGIEEGDHIQTSGGCFRVLSQKDFRTAKMK